MKWRFYSSLGACFQLGGLLWHFPQFFGPVPSTEQVETKGSLDKKATPVTEVRPTKPEVDPACKCVSTVLRISKGFVMPFTAAIGFDHKDHLSSQPKILAACPVLKHNFSCILAKWQNRLKGIGDNFKTACVNRRTKTTISTSYSYYPKCSLPQHINGLRL